MMHFILYH